MGPAFRAQFEDTNRVLKAIKSRSSARSIAVDFDATLLPAISTYHDVTDAYLVALAKSHGLRLATLDMSLLSKSWAAAIAFNPLES
jgi:predicted nucleic acid-binding protein